MDCVKILSVGLLVLIAVSVESRKLPPYITPCNQNDPGLNACLVREVEKIRPFFKKGIPEFDLPPFEPLHLPKVTMDHGNGAAVSFRADFTDLIISGAQNVVIKSVDLDIEQCRIDVHLQFPILRIESDYDLTGKVLVLPIRGKGHSDGNFTNIDSHMMLTGKYEIRDGKKYVKILNKKVDLTIADSKLHFDNLFNGNKELSDSTNRMINENSLDIVKEITPLVEETVATLVYEIVSRVFGLFSVDELLPPK